MAKILILSLGVGIKSREGNYPYRTANYRLGSQGDVVVSPFVAEALIEEVKPEVILVLGTVKSAWGAFYHKYHKEDCEFEKTVEDLENRIESMGKDTSAEEISGFQEQLNTLYAEKLCIKGNPKVEVCVTQYGLNETELKNNYIKIRETLKTLLNNMSQEEMIEISFDITHSFRSIPLYNLVVIDYCRLLMPQKIHISHVFYGNLDVARENIVDGKEIAEIVDLKDIVDVWEMTRGINEFSNTGNATSFLKWFDENNGREDAFIGALRRFHKAMQMNNRKELMEALEELFDAELPAEADALLDSKKTIRERLGREIAERPYNLEAPDERQKSKAKFQLQLAKWCLKNGQVGLASIIAKEALRSFSVVVYATASTVYEDEGDRKRGEQMLGNKMREQPEEPIFVRYKAIEADAINIRNTYAHNMEESVIDEESHVGVATEREGSRSPEEIIEEYIMVIADLMGMGVAGLQLCSSETTVFQDIEGITVLITEGPVNVAVKESLRGPRKQVWCLQGPFGLPDRKATRKERIKRLSRFITCKISKLVNNYTNLSSLNLKIVWGSTIPAELMQNGSLLLKAYMSNDMQNVHFYKLNGQNQEDLMLECLWQIDCESELSEEERQKIAVWLNGSCYSLEDISS